MKWLVDLLDKASNFLTSKIDFLNLGDYSPGAYIAAVGLIAVVLMFIIATIIRSRSKVKALTYLYEDVAAYINSIGPVDEEKAGWVYSKISTMPAFVIKGWDSFMSHQTAYPSDYITERDMANDTVSNPKSFAAKTFFNIASWIFIAICLVGTGIACKDLFKGELANITEVCVSVLGALALPIACYVILGVMLSSGCRHQVTELKAMFKEFQDALDSQVIIFKEEQDEFISENIEEINATIEEILANKLDDKEIIEIVTTPRVDTQNEFILEEIAAPVEEDIEVVATVEAEDFDTEDYDESASERQQQLLSLVYATDGLVQDPATTQSDIEQMNEILLRAKVSGKFRAEEEQEIFTKCIEILQYHAFNN